ncbi:hypothetical protein ACWEQ2_41335 [Streptomyces sp. NPDC004096]
MTLRWRTGVVVLGLLVALATVWGVACLCAPAGPVMRPAMPTAAASTLGYENPDHVCAVPAQDHCAVKAAVSSPATSPGPQPLAHTLPTRTYAWSAPGTAPSGVAYAVSPRPPNLHALQVLRT